MNETAMEEEFGDELIDDCLYEAPYVTERFWLVGVGGTSVAIVSFIENAFVFYMLMKRKTHRASPNLYLGLLAFFDMFMAGAYIPLMSLNLFADYFQSLPLLTAWYHYMIPLITVSHIAMTSSTFLIMAATVERYASTVKPHTRTSKFLTRNRVGISVFAVLMGFFTKLTMAFEITWSYDPKCEGLMTQWKIGVSEIALNEAYATYWKVAFRNVATVLFPFFVLLILNIRIIFAYKKTDFHYLSVQKLSEAKRKQRVRAATRALLLVVFTYLMSNCLNVLITIGEHFHPDYLANELRVFYIFSVDVVSLLTIFAGVLRLPIYVSCQSSLRREFAVQIRKWIAFWTFGSVQNYKHSKINQSETGRTCFTDDMELADGDANGGGQYANLLMALGTALLHETPSNTRMDSSTGDSPGDRMIRTASSDRHSCSEEMV